MTISASCGHILTEDEDLGVQVVYESEDCDPIDGFHPVVIYATYCRKCTADLVMRPEFISATFRDEDEVLSKL